MISSVLALAAAIAAQASDTTRQSREAFGSCLQRFVDRSIESQKSRGDFAAEYPQACAAEESAFRAAIIRRDTAARFSRADAEESAGLEVEDARFNFSERFDMAADAYEAAVEQAAAEQAGEPAVQPAAASESESAEAQQPPPTR